MGNRELRILLVAPRGEFFFRSEEFREYVGSSREMKTIRHTWNGTGVALPTIASLTPQEHDVVIVDENFEDIDFDQPYDIVGLTGNTQQATRAYDIAAEFRKRGRHVVMGGIHATVMPDEASGHVDTVFVGEAENTWSVFLSDYLSGHPEKRYDQARHRPVDMTRVPVPRFDLIAKYRYPVIWLQFSRGCPHDCEFCAASKIYGKRYKHKRAEQVIAEVEEAKRHWKFVQFGFADDNMFVNRRLSRELVAAFTPLNFVWLAQSDIAIGKDSEFLQALRASGCRILLIGLESVFPDNLAGLDRQDWKRKMFALYPEHIDRIQRSGIGVYGAFILGLDRDRPDTVERTVEFVNQNHIMGAQLALLTPFPGSRLRERLLREQRVLHSEWKWYTGLNAVIRHPCLTSEELEQGVMRFFRSIYSEDSYRRRAAYFREVCTNLVSTDLVCTSRDSSNPMPSNQI